VATINRSVAIALACAIGAGVCAATRALAAAAAYRVVPAKSTLRIEIGKSGAFSFAAGHTHEVTGPIEGRVTADQNDPARADIQITIRTAELKVSAAGEPPADVPKVQERMAGPDVLDVAHFPDITFRSTSIAASGKNNTTGTTQVTGQLTLHGRSREVTVPVRVQFEGGSLTASGTLSVKQTDFGIKPVSVAGVVNVKDALTIHFTITAAS